MRSIDSRANVSGDVTASELSAMSPHQSAQNPMPRYVLRRQHGALEVVHSGFSLWHVVGFALVMLPFFATFAILVYWNGRPSLDSQVVLFGIGGVYLFTCAAWAGLMYAGARLGQRDGVRLRYDRERGEVDLPAEGRTFALDEVVRLQVITSGRMLTSSRHEEFAEAPRKSELQLVTCRSNVLERWLLLSGQGSIRDFEEVLAPLSQRLPIPIITIRQKWLSTELIVQPYVPRRPQLHLRHLFYLTTIVGIVSAMVVQFGWFLGFFLATFTPATLYFGADQLWHGYRLGRRREAVAGVVAIVTALLCVLLSLLYAWLQPPA